LIGAFLQKVWWGSGQSPEKNQTRFEKYLTKEEKK